MFCLNKSKLLVCIFLSVVPCNQDVVSNNLFCMEQFTCVPGDPVHVPKPTSSSMNLARHSITSTTPIHIYDARFDSDCKIFTTSTPAGFAVYRTCPLQLIRKRGIFAVS